MNIKQLITFYCISDKTVYNIYQKLRKAKEIDLEDFELLFLIFQSNQYLIQKFNKHLVHKCGQIQLSFGEFVKQNKNSWSLNKNKNNNDQENYVVQQLIQTYNYYTNQQTLQSQESSANVAIDDSIQQDFDKQNELQFQSTIYKYVKVIDKNLKTYVKDWVLIYISSLIEESLAHIRIDPIYFLNLNCHNGSDFMLEVFMCRKIAYLGFECNKINIFYINSTLFEEQVKQIERQKKLEDRHVTYSTLINCRFCKKFMITFSSKQTSLGADEISRNKCVCNNQECRRTFTVA